MSRQLSVLVDGAHNLIAPTTLGYVSEAAPWVIWAEGQSLTAELNTLGLLQARVTRAHWLLRDHIVHFGSFHTMLQQGKPHPALRHPRAIGTIFHLVPGAERNTVLPEIVSQLATVHTASHTTARELRAHGIPVEKITVIPLGISLNRFKPGSLEQKMAVRRELGITEDAFVIGSFQKDGIGWDTGMVPKLEKGPDVFVETIAMLARNVPVHVLLVGPARGYVEHELARHGVAVTSIGYVQHTHDVAQYYHALDAYLITARVEGGPKALLEAWASGVPIISTPVGMVPDVAHDKETALLATNASELAHAAATLRDDPGLQELLRTNALKAVQQYDWSIIAQRYFTELYRPLL